MKEDSSCFTRWEEKLPSPEELMPLSQSLITPDLALAFDISPNPTIAPALNRQGDTTGNQRPNTPPRPLDLDSSDHSVLAGASAASDEPARTLKRPRLVWTPQLHKRFVDAVAHLGIKNAVPKTIMQLMSVDGLTRENVASHLQKYRLYLKRMQGLSCSAIGASGGAATPGSILVGDAATEQLFAGNPIPYQFLGRGSSRTGQEPLMQFIGPPSVQHPPMAAAVQQQFYHQRQMGRFGSPMVGGGFEYGIHNRPPGLHGMGSSGMGATRPSLASAPSNSYEDDVVSGAGERRKILTLFPTSAEE